jgi:putative sigma-54 modulation protein
LQISVTGHGLETSDALRDFVSDKLSRMDKFARISKIQVILKAEPKGGRHVEVVCHLPGGKSLVASASHDDSYAAVDLVTDKLQRQISKVQGRRRERRYQDRRERDRQAAAGGRGAPPTGTEEEEEEGQ